VYIPCVTVWKEGPKRLEKTMKALN